MNTAKSATKASLLTKDGFSELKQKIDDETVRAGWSKAFCKRYIKHHYGKRTRLHMTDDQLVHLFNTLISLNKAQTIRKKTRKRKRI